MRPHIRFLLNIMISDMWTTLLATFYFVLWLCLREEADDYPKHWTGLYCINSLTIMYVCNRNTTQILSEYV